MSGVNRSGEPSNFNAPRVAGDFVASTRTVPIVPLSVEKGAILSPEEALDLKYLLPMYKKSNKKLLELETKLLQAITADNASEKTKWQTAIDMENTRVHEFLINNKMGPLFEGVDTLRGFVDVLKKRLEFIVRKQNGSSESVRVVL